ncbi:Detected protein of unknown function [Hibiscus syriacus]|uniref:CRIB domain-containing protein n=1 Tax=Hibiscus syriacus TaxID=106335 RepID=A0A6A3CGI5_HIBSY|nr:Detected protein of unknown function [Hibiscus syriacus]
MVAQESDQEDECRQDGERKARDKEEAQQLPLITILVTAFRKSLICCTISGSKELCSIEIGLPTNVKHVSHVTFDRFHGFLGLPVDLEPEVPRRPPSARELPSGVLDSLPPELVIKSQSEEECGRLMNARNIAMVFAPNMTQMMNLFKALVIRVLKEREDSMIDSTPISPLEPSDKNGRQSYAQLDRDVNNKVKNESEGDDAFVAHSAEENLMTNRNNSKSFLICSGNRSPVDNIVASQVKTSANDLVEGSFWSVSEKRRNGQSSLPSLKKGSKKAKEQSTECEPGAEQRSKGTLITNRINSRTELSEAWR